MTKKLAKKLYDWYMQSIKLAKELDSVENIHRMCNDRKVNIGVCHCAKSIFRSGIYADNWVNKNAKNRGYWCAPVYSCLDIAGILKALQFRADRLKEFIDNGK